MLSTPKAKGGLFLASSLCDGLEDNDIRQVATLLLNKDADPNILIPMHGVTPFHLVIGNDSEEFAEEVTKLFLRHGGNPNVRSNDGMTPVHVAAAWGRTNILELLLTNGGDPLCLDNDGRSPFHYAFDGKYFKVITLLSKYCENIQDKDDKPKYNMLLDKVLISNGDVIAEYITSRNVTVDTDVYDMTRKITHTDHYDKSNSSSVSAVLASTPNIYDVTETKCKLSKSTSECSFRTNHTIAVQASDHLLQSDKKVTSNCSFINLDFDFANLYLTDVVQKENHFVSQIINHLSISLTSDYSINESLHNYKKIKHKETSIVIRDPDTSFQSEKNASFHKCNYYRNSEEFSPKLRNNCTSMKRWSNGRQSTCKKKCKKILDKMPTCSLNNSIISMSPNFNTPNHTKRRNIAKTPLTPSHIFNDSIISKSPNFATPVCTCRKRNPARTLHVNDNLISSKISKRSDAYKSQYVEFNECKRYIAQSTPRRKKRSICKPVKKRFDLYQHESDIISDAFTINSLLKPVNLDKTIFSAEDITCHNSVNSYNEYPSYVQQFSQKRRQNYNNHLTMQLNEGKYNKDSIIHNNNLNHLDKTDLSNSFNEMEKENEFANSFNNDKEYIKSENNEINAEFVTIRRNIFKTDKALETADTSINNVKSTCTTSSSQKENIVNCINCDTKDLLNEDLNMNISKICKHEKNWCNDKFHENLPPKLENNSLLTINLPAICGKQVYLSDFRRSSFLKIGGSNSDSKQTENVSAQAKNLDLNSHKIEKSSSLLTYISAQEEYKYEDPEEGVILLERRLCVTPFSTFNDNECDVKNEIAISDASTASTCQSLPKELLIMDDITLRKELEQLGTQPGPITSTTKQVYLKRLMRLRNIQENNVPLTVLRNFSKTFTAPSNQIKPHLQLGDWLNHLDIYKSLEKEVFQAFVSPDPTRKWREGTSKTSFTYLLLDPRVTQNLPNRCASLTESEKWSIFLNAIFYIGKGKRSRPFAHLYDAFKIWVGKSINTNKKINHILDIWNSDHGVICLHVFQNVIPVEAYTREAVMIDAIGKEQLKNCKGGEYYGITATWNIQQKQKFGRYLLYKAMQILMFEGESQLFPCNL